MKIVHRFRIMIDVFVFDVCLIRAKMGLKMMLFARMTTCFALKIAFIRAKMGPNMMVFARMSDIGLPYMSSIESPGGAYAAGIGGGNNGAGGSINIYGGTISATAGLDAAGIGGGQNGD